MRVTRVLLVLSVLLLGLGLASLVASCTVARPMYSKMARDFADQYAQGNGKTYDELRDRASQAHMELADKRVGEIALTGGAALAVGALFLCWAIDRARLVSRIRRLSKP